jgi:DNA-binding NarL/FixJ family response regulator
MSSSQVLLANESRLLRYLLFRVLDPQSLLTIVGEIEDEAELPAKIDEVEPDWVVVSTAPGEIGARVSDDTLLKHPDTKILVIPDDAGAASVYWWSRGTVQSMALEHPSLAGIVEVLGSHSPEELIKCLSASQTDPSNDQQATVKGTDKNDY